MAGQSGRNTKISPLKLGCRLPCESPAAGDGYAGAGPLLDRLNEVFERTVLPL